jgi:hypothetical protein
MAAANTYVSIATQTLGSAAASVTFSSIPSTYTDLVLVMTAKSATADYLAIRFNGDTTTTYSNTYVAGFGSTTQSSRNSNNNQIQIDGGVATSTIDGYNGIFDIQNYANTTTYKTLIGRSNNAAVGASATIGMWRSTSAINSVTVLGYFGYNLSIGSTFSLYGILAA